MAQTYYQLIAEKKKEAARSASLLKSIDKKHVQAHKDDLGLHAHAANQSGEKKHSHAEFDVLMQKFQNDEANRGEEDMLLPE